MCLCFSVVQIIFLFLPIKRAENFVVQQIEHNSFVICLPPLPTNLIASVNTYPLIVVFDAAALELTGLLRKTRLDVLIGVYDEPASTNQMAPLQGN